MADEWSKIETLDQSLHRLLGIMVIPNYTFSLNWLLEGEKKMLMKAILVLAHAAWIEHLVNVG